MDDRRRVLGYEHDYRIWMDYSVEDVDTGSLAYHFEIRTNFILKKHELGQKMMMLLCSENFRVYVDTLHMFDPLKSSEPQSDLRVQLLPRLREYWMLDHEIEELVRKSLDCYASGRLSGPLRRFVAPVVVEMDVVTVQLAGEGAAAALDRAIGVERLVPLRFHDFDEVGGFCWTKNFYLMLQLPRTRVVEEEDAGEGIMVICAICLREPRIGDQISVLDCKHAFHYHCIVTWLMRNDTCPLCRCRFMTINPLKCCLHCYDQIDNRSARAN